LWDRILCHLQARKMRGGQIDWELFCIDGTVIRAHQSAAGAPSELPPGEPEDHALGRSQGGFGTKLTLVCDGEGTPLAVAVAPGQEHETQQFIPALGRFCLACGNPARKGRSPVTGPRPGSCSR
jgi:hypothetical protein